MSLIGKNLTLKYDKNIIIENESFEFQENKINVILGPNGSGKTTLFKSLCKQLIPSSGNILLNDKNISKYKNKDFAKIISILFQENIAPNDLTVKELISYGRFAHISLFSDLNKEDNEIIEDAMNLTNIKQFENKIIDELSSGQKQLVWIAMLIAQDSKYLLLDEPTTYLDLKNQFEIMNCIKKINDKLNKTIILILHDINLAAQYADYIFMLKDKKIKYKGLPIEILSEDHIKDIYDINVKIIKENKNILICPFNQ